MKRDEKFRLYIDRLKNTVDHYLLLKSLGFNVNKQGTNELRCACRVHGGDNSTAFRFRRDTGTWVCFTKGCHEDYGNDIISLVKAVMGLNFRGAVQYIESFVGTDPFEAGIFSKLIEKDRDNFIKRNTIVKSRRVTEDYLQQFKKLRSDLFNRDGFSNDVLNTFEVAGGYMDKYGKTRDIIPIRNHDNELVAFSMRDISENAGDDKYILTEGFDKDNTLYNLNNAKTYANDVPLIVVEGFKSVWRLYSYDIPNVIAIMGARLTVGQINLLYAYALRGIVLMLDNDEAGHKGTSYACQEIGRRMPVSVVNIKEIDNKGKGLDPSDLSKETIYKYLGV